MKIVAHLILVLGLAQMGLAQEATGTQKSGADVNEAYVSSLKTTMAGLIHDIETFGTGAIGISMWVEQSNYCASQDMFYSGASATGADTNGCILISPQ